MRPFERLRALSVWQLIALLFLLVSPAHAQTFPPLTGRVVDNAHLLSPEQSAALDAKLAGIEQRSGHQLVVATLSDLQGYDIETYGYQLGRTWALGKKGVNDGAILIVAPKERKVRVEVGYGLEPVLTDAYSSVVINSVILPRFKGGDYPGGIDAGVDAIAQQIALPPDQAQARAAQLQASQAQQSRSGPGIGTLLFWAVIFLFFILPLLRGMFGGRGGRRGGSGLGNVILWSALNAAANSRSSGWGGGGGWGGGDSGGGFSGGGGSFGGGGASGGW